MKMRSSSHTIIDELTSIYPVPISLDEVAADEGLCVLYDDYGEDTFDGMTWYEPEQGKFFIHINTQRGNRKDNVRGRFTLAHELGHYFIDHHRHALESGRMQPHIHRYEPFGRNEEWVIEREADSFAANLLMPTEQFKLDFRGVIFSGELIQTIAAKYNVSFSSCALRYLSMNLVPIMLVYAEKGIIKWQMKSQDFPFFRMKYGKGRVPENTVMGDFFFKGDSSSCNQSEIVFAGDCFHTYSEEQNRIQIYEYCIPHKGAALSLFWEK